MDRNYRIHTNIANDTVLNVNMQQDYDFLEVLSIKLRQKDAYKLHSSNYGVIIGRVLANDAFGIPNAKISVFIERDGNDASDLETIYPYSEVTSRDKEGRRYNLLPDYSDNDCYRIVGTFPNKRLVLDNDTYLEVYDKYWKYSTVTNNAGDYMIFGVPSGNQQIHVDLDLSDIGMLSQKPRDFIYKGYNITMFDNASQFKESTNIDNLAQIFSQNKSVFVYPFWGDADNGIAAITRSDVQIQYKFEPTCVFMGSIISDNEANSIGHKCAPEVNNGMNDQLIAGEGTIEMIRKTTDGLVEEYQINGNQLIDENGVWCYQIPMNLDFIGTDEYGNIAPTDDPTKGIPTRAQVRFRISKNESGTEGFSRHTAKYLVPMNPRFSDKEIRPYVVDRGEDIEKMYNFGSTTPDSCFRDLYWNNVYSVKNYIPKAQVAHRVYAKNYTALKGSNLVTDQNPVPFNKLRVDIPFVYMIVCILFTIVTVIVTVINAIMSFIYYLVKVFCLPRLPVVGKICPFAPIGWIFDLVGGISCISLGGGLSEDNTAYYPGCWKKALKASKCPADMESGCKQSNETSDLLDKVQQKLAEDYKIVKLDFYQDWLNGSLYMPLWFWRKRKKKSFLFFTLARAKSEYCDCDKRYSRLKTYVTCNVKYSDTSLRVTDSSVPERENSWHRAKGRSKWVRYLNGLIKGVENKDGLTAYYYAAIQATSENKQPNLDMKKRTKKFLAVRLYATDIILLGNLDENNIYGIPQFFKALPSTTANIPPIAVVKETNEDDTVIGKDSENELASEDESGTSITTGMDWGHDGGKQTPSYKDGLFIDLSCTYAHSKAKACFNVERLSELGVSLDTSYKMAYAKNANGIETGDIDTDGFITKYELDDMENRAMFATLNHIGFIPQAYQDSISGYTTQVEDERTNYLVPKFKYIYPVDFDGRMQVLMNRYKGNFQQSQYDDADEGYITFRLGGEKDEKDEYGRTRHFYYDNSGYEMPLYNNSFYFYFGIKKGSTAIDKFNELFYAQCFKNVKHPFTLDISTRGRSYCPKAYKAKNKDDAYGYIRVKTDDIQAPYSYTLYDEIGSVIIHEKEMTMADFVIGGVVDENDTDKIIMNENGAVKYQLTNQAVNNRYGSSGLTNQEYVLDITDVNGKTISNKVKLEMDKIEFEYDVRNLGTKFYNIQDTRMDYICNDDTNFYGIIKITKFFVDGYEIMITGAEIDTNKSNNEKYVVNVTGNPITYADDEEGSPLDDNITATFYLYSLEQEQSVKDCLCDMDNNMTTKEQTSIEAADKNYYFNSKDNNNNYLDYFEFYVYQPNGFIGEIAQVCDGVELEDNKTSSIIQVLNGENFNTYLSTMPTRFMIGTTSDNKNAVIGSTSHFYNGKRDAVTIAREGISNKIIDGWFGTHQEDSYQFNTTLNKTIEKNKDVWSDFLTIGTTIMPARTKKSILRYKFQTMFKLSDATYTTNSSTNVFTYSATGGVGPRLFRMVSPFYRDATKMFTKYVYNEENMASMPPEYPNIVGINYRDSLEKTGLSDKTYELIYTNSTKQYCYSSSPRFNHMYKQEMPSGNDKDKVTCDGLTRKYIGNYFAAFTNNGRYSANGISGDCSINIQQLPNYAPVNIEDGEWKRIGREQTLSDLGNTKNRKKVHTKMSPSKDGSCQKDVTLPYLRALSVDRRFDFNFVVFGPVQAKSFKLHNDDYETYDKYNENGELIKLDQNGKELKPNDAGYNESNTNATVTVLTTDRNRTWKSARISGVTFGGIEMSYDLDYNIISADTIENYTIPELESTYEDSGQIPPVYHTMEEASGAVMSLLPDVPLDDIPNHIEEGESTASANTRLEYSYYVSEDDEDSYTIYNSGGTTSSDYCLWQNWEDTSARDLYKVGDNDIGSVDDETSEPNETGDGKRQAVKMLYRADLDDIDVRQLFWSSFNKIRLNKYGEKQGGKGYTLEALQLPSMRQEYNTSSGTIEVVPYLPYYVFKHYEDGESVNDNTYSEGMYNGDFNRGTASHYPTRRLIDIGNFSQNEEIYFNFTSCSYGMNPELTDDGLLRAEALNGEETEFSIDFSSPITVINPNPENKDYGNIVYNWDFPTSYSADSNTWVRYTASTCSIAFNYNKVSNDNFNIYTHCPIMIRVLPYISGTTNNNDWSTDGITYIKTTSTSGGIFDNKSLFDRISDLIIYLFAVKRSSIYGIGFGDTYLPEGVEFYNYEVPYMSLPTEPPSFKKDGERLNSDEDDFENIQFIHSNIKLKDKSSSATVFTILTMRDYVSQDDDHLTKQIRTYETSELFDARNIELKIDGNDENSEFLSAQTCVVYSSGNPAPIPPEPDPPVNGASAREDGEGGEGGSSEEDGSGLTQNLGFVIKIPLRENNVDINPQKLNNQAFIDYSMMDFTFKVSNFWAKYYLSAEAVPEYVCSNRERYVNTSPPVSAVVDTFLLHLKISFSRDMGILSDVQWKSHLPDITILAKTPSGFVYKIPFEIRDVKQDPINYTDGAITPTTIIIGKRRLIS